jgi:hypothetical protein
MCRGQCGAGIEMRIVRCHCCEEKRINTAAWPTVSSKLRYVRLHELGLRCVGSCAGRGSEL